jgi:hypothetical protein
MMRRFFTYPAFVINKFDPLGCPVWINEAPGKMGVLAMSARAFLLH